MPVFTMESDDENLVIEQMQMLDVSDESLPGEAPDGAGGGGDSGESGDSAPTVPPINHNLMESEWDTFQSSIAR